MMRGMRLGRGGWRTLSDSAASVPAVRLGSVRGTASGTAQDEEGLDLTPVLRVRRPPARDPPVPLLIDSPHSGRLVPRGWECRLSPSLGADCVRQAEDSYVDELWSGDDRLPRRGFTPANMSSLSLAHTRDPRSKN